jgi:hypothetical protein
MVETEHDFDTTFRRTLLRMAGRIDDEASALITHWLSVGEEGLALDLLTGTLRERHLPVTSEETTAPSFRLIRGLRGTIHCRCGVEMIPDARSTREHRSRRTNGG